MALVPRLTRLEQALVDGPTIAGGGGGWRWWQRAATLDWNTLFELVRADARMPLTLHQVVDVADQLAPADDESRRAVHAAIAALRRLAVLMSSATAFSEAAAAAWGDRPAGEAMRTEMAVDTAMLVALRTWIEKLECFADETRRGAAALVSARQRKKRPADESEPRRTRIEVVDDGDPPVAD